MAFQYYTFFYIDHVCTPIYRCNRWSTIDLLVYKHFLHAHAVHYSVRYTMICILAHFVQLSSSIASIIRLSYMHMHVLTRTVYLHCMITHYIYTLIDTLH